MFIRKLGHFDFAEASDLLWKTYYEYEKNNTSMDGMEFFRDVTSPVSLEMNSYDGNIDFFGCFDDSGKLSAVSAVKEKKHILLLYVRKDLIGCGIGQKLLTFSEKKCLCDDITVNSSDYAVKFYEKNGYIKTEERKVENGLVFTPMVKNRSRHISLK